MTIEGCIRLLVLGGVLFGLTSCANQATAVNVPPEAHSVPLGIDLGASSRAPIRVATNAASTVPRNDAAQPPVESVADAQTGTHAVGVVNSVDTAQKRVNLSHGPIPAIGWPAMTMDFTVLPSVDLSAVKPGSRIDATLRKGKNNSYEIESIRPAAGQ